MELSNRQRLILAAVKKMEEGERLFREGSIEFDQLTGGEEGKKIGSGGQDVTVQAHRIVRKSNNSNSRKKKKIYIPSLDIAFLDNIVNVIAKNTTEPFPTAHWLEKEKISGGWVKINAGVAKLVEDKRLIIINKPRSPGSKIISKCLAIP